MSNELKPVSILLHLTKNIRLANNLDGWFEKLGKYGRRMNLDEFIAHLHIGFKMHESWACHENRHPATNTDLIRCYLNMADGHCGDKDVFWTPEDRNENMFGKPDVEYFDRQDELGNRYYVKPSEIRQRIAQKAMKELTQNFFKKHLPEEGKKLNEDWAVDIVKKGLLADLQYFFRVEEKYDTWRITNLMISWRGPSSDERIVISFLLNLARFLWECRGSDNFQAQLDQAKPWMIEVLADLGKLYILNNYLLHFEKASLNKLEEIALRTKLDRYKKHPVNNDRLVRNIEEALYAGSAAAVLLFRRASSVKVNKNLRMVQEAEQRMRDAERRLEKLQSGQ